MSNTLAIAAVTSTVRYVLEGAIAGPPGPVGGATVTTLHPADVPPVESNAGETHKGINIFLYQVTPNHAGNLSDLPTRRPDGSLANRPTAVLDLHYLFTFHGDDAELDTQRLLARTVLALAVTPVLGRDLVSRALDEYAEDTPTAFLADADLAEQVELVKLAPAAMTLEELGRLWPAFGTGYRLGLTYTATLVVLEADLAVRAALPVRVRSISVAPASRPQIAWAAASDGAAISTGTTVDVRGSGLLGPGLAVRIGRAELAPGPAAAPDLVPVTLTPAVPAGVLSLQIIHRTPGDAGRPARVVARTNAVPVLVRPAVSVTTITADTVTLTVVPPLQAGQHAVVNLSPDDGTSPALSFTLRSPEPGQPPADTVELDRGKIPDGTWLVRLAVDGAESLPVLTGDTYGGPALVLS